MTYFVTVTFDIADGRPEDYEAVYEDFAKIGLNRSLSSGQGGTVHLPTTTTAGEFTGQGAGALRDRICDLTQQCFTRRRLSGEIFVAVGGDWAWGHRRP